MDKIKYQVIQKAYEAEGFDWETIKNNVSEQGFLDMEILPEYNEDNFDYYAGGIIRPYSLDGVENNNNWTKINTAKDLPIIDCSCRIILISGRTTLAEYSKKHNEFLTIKSGYLNWRKITHYSPILDLKKPLF